MNILFYRYGSICEPDLIAAFEEHGHQVDQITKEIYDKKLPPQETLKVVSAQLDKGNYNMVFTINFFPIISDICNIYKIRYVCWTVDSPVLELFSKPIKNQWNRVFLFDLAQYNDVHQFNPDCIFYLPLATNYKRWQDTIGRADLITRQYYSSDVSFVGSLYTEKCPYDKVENLPEYIKGYLNGIMTAQLSIYGSYFIDELLDSDIVTEFMKHAPGLSRANQLTLLSDKMLISQFFIGNKISAMERVSIMKKLADAFNVDIYTGSDTSYIKGIHNKGTANSLTEMPLVFNQSKINLNITSKAIRSGLPLRVWDILGCGGFCLTNYQAELTEYFTPGEHLDCYTSMDELEDKISYYLLHENKRKEIIANARHAIKEAHTYNHRVTDMLNIAFSF